MSGDRKAGGRTDLPVFDDCPLEALDVQADSSQGREQDNGLQPHLFPVIVFRFGSPVQERHNIFGHLSRC